ncbi:hypothetical protein, partial [Haloquadratum walsbyi]
MDDVSTYIERLEEVTETKQGAAETEAEYINRLGQETSLSESEITTTSEAITKSAYSPGDLSADEEEVLDSFLEAVQTAYREDPTQQEATTDTAITDQSDNDSFESDEEDTDNTLSIDYPEAAKTEPPEISDDDGIFDIETSTDAIKETVQANRQVAIIVTALLVLLLTVVTVAGAVGLMETGVTAAVTGTMGGGDTTGVDSQGSTGVSTTTTPELSSTQTTTASSTTTSTPTPEPTPIPTPTPTA